jgi:CheY-like chemotaxis protein
MSLTENPPVLVVEDESLVRLLVVQALQEAGYQVHEAGEACGAMQTLRAHEGVSLMVTDVGLPGLDGRRLAERARALRPGLKILFMTGYGEPQLEDGPLPQGVDLITKPFALNELAARAAALIAG